MDQKQLLKLQAERGVKAESLDEASRSIDTVISECRRKIEEDSAKYRDLDVANKRDTIKSIIVEYVMNTMPVVDGYVNSNNEPDTIKLVNKLVEAITDYDILTAAMVDPEIFEIRSNGKEIKVERKGHVEDLKDADGTLLSWQNPEQQEIVLRKMLGDVRLTPKSALVSGSTIEGFRIAAVHSSATSSDPRNPTAPRYHSFVLRKFNEVKMGIPDIVERGTLSDNMGRLLALLPAGGLTFFTVGPTASGKTTTNNAILQSVPATTRTVLLQNPSEIDLRFRDNTGRVYNDVLHLEAREIENATNSDPTMANLMNQVLRLSPTFVSLGEIRSNVEFAQAMKILLAGHPLNTTYHAESSDGAIKRFLSAYLAASGNEPSELALGTLTSLVNIIIVQKIMRDGIRRIIQISEVLGVKENNPNQPELNDLYKFIVDGEPEYDEAGNVKRIHGHHRRVGKLSDKTIAKLQLEGVSLPRFDFLTKPISEDELETYTGKNILGYGLSNNEN